MPHKVFQLQESRTPISIVALQLGTCPPRKAGGSTPQRGWGTRSLAHRWISGCVRRYAR
jgi:hypothetical protein